MKVALRQAVEADIALIAADARDADVAEMAAVGLAFEAALRASFERSDWTATGTIDDVPVCMFGVAPANVLYGEGVPWMLAANGLLRAQKQFLKTCRPVVDMMLRSYPRLANVIDERNTVAMRWLRWLGFKFDDVRVPFRGHAFRIFRLGDWS